MKIDLGTKIVDISSITSIEKVKEGANWLRLSYSNATSNILEFASDGDCENAYNLIRGCYGILKIPGLTAISG